MIRRVTRVCQTDYALINWLHLLCYAFACVWVLIMCIEYMCVYAGAYARCINEGEWKIRVLHGVWLTRFNSTLRFFICAAQMTYWNFLRRFILSFLCVHFLPFFLWFCFSLFAHRSLTKSMMATLWTSEYVTFNKTAAYKCIINKLLHRIWRQKMSTCSRLHIAINVQSAFMLFVFFFFFSFHFSSVNDSSCTLFVIKIIIVDCMKPN